MKRVVFLLIVVAAVGLAGCGGRAGSGGASPSLDLIAANNEATRAVIEVARQATAAVQAQQTAEAAQATAAHEEMLRATAGAATAVAMQMTVDAATSQALATTAAQSTTDALVVRQTEVAMQMAVDAATAQASATNEAATPTAAAQQTADAQIAANVALVQRDTEIKMAQEQRQADMRLQWQPVIYAAGAAALGAIVLAGLGFVGFVIWRAIHLQRHPVYVPVGGGPRIVQQSRGLLAPPELLAITARAGSAGTGANGNGRLLPITAGPPPRVELPAMTDAHVLVVGETSTGKSGALREVIKRRAGDVYVVDPHYRPGAWPANVKEIVGVSSRYDCVEDLLTWLGDELRRRIERRAANDVDFRPITIAMDEQPDLNKKVAVEALDMWKDVVRQGAKYSLFVIMGTQSYLVKEMGIEGESSVLRNFQYMLLLGSFAIEKRRDLEPLANRAAVVVQSRRTPTPVIIPYHAHEDPRSPEFRPRAELPPVNEGLYHAGTTADEFFEGGRVGESFILPAPGQVVEVADPLNYGMQTSRGFVSPSEVGRILEAREAGLPHYKIEGFAFGKDESGKDRNGGAFYYMVEEVLRYFDMSDSTVSTGST